MEAKVEEPVSTALSLDTEADLFVSSNVPIDSSNLPQIFDTSTINPSDNSGVVEDPVSVKSPLKRTKPCPSGSDRKPSSSSKALGSASTSSDYDEPKHKKYHSEASSMPQTPELSANETELEDLGESEILDDEEDDVEKEDEDEDDVIALGDDEDDDDDVESVVTRLITPALQQEREARKIEDRKLLALLAHFDEEQLNRFETFRRAAFAKKSIRRLIQSIATCSFSHNVVIAMAGATKVFIGELVEEALDYKERLGESGPLQPKHIREAFRLLSEAGSCPTRKQVNPFR